MDARVADAAALTWSVDLLRSESIPLRLVGLLGWVEAGEHPLYIPLRVSHERGSPPDTDYVFQILPNARLRSVAVTLASVGAAGERPSGSYIRNGDQLPQPSFTVAETFEIWIPRAELPKPGVYFMEVLATQADESTPDKVTWMPNGCTSRPPGTWLLWSEIPALWRTACGSSSSRHGRS